MKIVRCVVLCWLYVFWIHLSIDAIAVNSNLCKFNKKIYWLTEMHLTFSPMYDDSKHTFSTEQAKPANQSQRKPLLFYLFANNKTWVNYFFMTWCANIVKLEHFFFHFSAVESNAKSAHFSILLQSSVDTYRNRRSNFNVHSTTITLKHKPSDNGSSIQNGD